MVRETIELPAFAQALQECNFEVMTEIQAKSIPHLLKGKDATSPEIGLGGWDGFLPIPVLIFNFDFQPSQ